MDENGEDVDERDNDIVVTWEVVDRETKVQTTGATVTATFNLLFTSTWWSPVT